MFILGKKYILILILTGRHKDLESNSIVSLQKSLNIKHKYESEDTVSHSPVAKRYN